MTTYRMAPSPDIDIGEPGVERVIVNIDGLDELSAIREALDGIREDIDWWLNNHRREQWLPIQPITSMPLDPTAADWSERLNRFSTADVPAMTAREQPLCEPRPTQPAMADAIDGDRHFCCEHPDLKWTGDPQFPGVECMNCGYIVADCGSVVMQRSPEADPEPKEQQRALFADQQD